LDSKKPLLFHKSMIVSETSNDASWSQKPWKTRWKWIHSSILCHFCYNYSTCWFACVLFMLICSVFATIPSGHSTGSYDVLCKITVQRVFIHHLSEKKAIASAWLGSTTGYTIKIQCPFTPWVSNIRKIHSMLMLWCWYSKHIIMKDPHSVTFFFTESPSFVVKRGDWGALGRT